VFLEDFKLRNEELSDQKKSISGNPKSTRENASGSYP
jgi:hypothetical protein